MAGTHHVCNMRLNNTMLKSKTLRSVILVAKRFASGQTNESKLLNDLLKNYDARVRPVKSHTETVNAKFGVGLNDLMEVSPLTCELHGWIKQSWPDKFLSWDPNKYGGIQQTVIHPILPSKGPIIWTPDFMLYNGQTELLDTVPPRAALWHEGHVTWFVPCIFKVRFIKSSDGNNGECKLSFGTWIYNKKEVDIKDRGGGTIEDYLSFGSPWKLTEKKFKIEDAQKWGGNETYRHIDIFMKFVKAK